MFGGGFALNDVYRKERGSGLSVSMEAAFLGSLASLPFLFAFNGFVLDFTPFTLIMATLAALNGNHYSNICTQPGNKRESVADSNSGSRYSVAYGHCGYAALHGS